MTSYILLVFFGILGTLFIKLNKWEIKKAWIFYLGLLLFAIRFAYVDYSIYSNNKKFFKSELHSVAIKYHYFNSHSERNICFKNTKVKMITWMYPAELINIGDSIAKDSNTNIYHLFKMDSTIHKYEYYGTYEYKQHD